MKARGETAFGEENAVRGQRLLATEVPIGVPAQRRGSVTLRVLAKIAA